MIAQQFREIKQTLSPYRLSRESRYRSSPACPQAVLFRSLERSRRNSVFYFRELLVIAVAPNQHSLPFDFFDYTSISLSVAFIILLVILMIALLWAGWLWDKRRPPTGPYGTLPMRPAVELPYATIGKVYIYLTSLHQYDNRMFNIHRSMVCRATGRIFPDCVDLLGRITCDWSFVRRRYPGYYVSWGSLNDAQKAEVRRAHKTLDGFQIEFSFPEPSPRAITPEYALASPGPLYVDLETKVLVGWKQVPGTEVEVLVVQHPRKHYSPTEV